MASLQQLQSIIDAEKGAQATAPSAQATAPSAQATAPTLEGLQSIVAEGAAPLTSPEGTLGRIGFGLTKGSLESIAKFINQASGGFDLTQLTAPGVPFSTKPDHQVVIPQQFEAPTQGVAGKIGEDIGGILPFLVGGAAVEKGISEATPLLGRILQRFAGFAPIGASQDPQNKLAGALTAGIGGAVLPELLTGGPAVVRKVISMLPGGKLGASNIIADRIGQITDELGKGSFPEGASDDLFNRMLGKLNEIRSRESAAYDNFNDLTKGRELFSKKNTVNAINDALDNLPKRVLSEKNKELQANLLELKDQVESSSNIANLKELDTDINERLRNPNIINKVGNIAGVLSPIKQAIAQDFEKTAVDSGRPEVLDAWNQAKAITRDEKAPFLSDRAPRGGSTPSAFAKLLRQEFPQTGKFFNTTIKASVKNDDTGGIDKILSLMPEDESRDLLALHHLSGTDGTAGAILKRFGQLGAKQRETLFPNHVTELNNMLKLMQKEPELFSTKAPKGILSDILSPSRLIAGTAADRPFIGGALNVARPIGGLLSRIAFRFPGFQRQILRELGSPVAKKGAGILSRLSPTALAILSSGAARGIQSANNGGL